ncbi:MAG: hypothetical protein P1V36_10855, partial [Planctomycetota bacterium]|nr:hypothetical protein [Planctomycetota bacterium]
RPVWAEDGWEPITLAKTTVAQRGDLRSPTLRGRTGVTVRGLIAPDVGGLAIVLGKQRALLLDLDGDGVHGTPGDGYVAPGSRTAGPWCGEVWHAGGGLRIRGTSKTGFEQAPLVMPRPKDKDHTRAWCLLQWRRQQCGVRPVQYDRELEAAMIKHAEYLARHPGAPAHDEQPGTPGYSPEGARAGQNCIIGHGDTGALSALQMHLATLYHRTRPLQPGLTHTAIVFHRGVFLLNVFERRGGPLKGALLVYPPHGMEGVALRFHPHGENPMPVAGVKKGSHMLGTAVNVFSEPLRLAHTLAEEPTLAVFRPRKKARPLESHFHFPGKPPAAKVGASNRGCVARIPKKPLRGKTRYVATTRIPLPDGTVFDYAWSFTTGRK